MSENEYSKYSFAFENKKKMNYDEFLENHKAEPLTWAIQDNGVKDLLIGDIELPEFYATIASLEQMHIM